MTISEHKIKRTESAEIARQTAEFLKKGGKIIKLKPDMSAEKNKSQRFN